MILKPTTKLLLRHIARKKGRGGKPLNPTKRKGLTGLMRDMQQKKGKQAFRKTRIGALQRLEKL